MYEFNTTTHARLLRQPADFPFTDVWRAVNGTGIGLFDPRFTNDVYGESFRVANVLSCVFTSSRPVVCAGH